MQNEWADDIPGFSVLLQKGGLLQKSKTKNRIGSEVFLLPEENGIWCTAVTADIISHFVHFEQVESYYRILDFERETLSPQASPFLCAEYSLCDRLIDLILEADLGNRKLPVIFGAQYTGKRLLIHLVLQAIEAGMGGIEWWEIDYFLLWVLCTHPYCTNWTIKYSLRHKIFLVRKSLRCGRSCRD